LADHVFRPDGPALDLHGLAAVERVAHRAEHVVVHLDDEPLLAVIHPVLLPERLQQRLEIPNPEDAPGALLEPPTYAPVPFAGPKLAVNLQRLETWSRAGRLFTRAAPPSPARSPD
jgi:hypothetical protein